MQDYNVEVLKKLTAPNYACNLGSNPKDWTADGKHARFFFGAWSSLNELHSSLGLSGTYDYIFSSDSIYSLDSQEHLLDCITRVRFPICYSYFYCQADRMTVMA